MGLNLIDDIATMRKTFHKASKIQTYPKELVIYAVSYVKRLSPFQFSGYGPIWI